MWTWWPFKQRPAGIGLTAPDDLLPGEHRSRFCTHPGPCPGWPALYQGRLVNGMNTYPHSSTTGEIL